MKEEKGDKGDTCGKHAVEFGRRGAGVILHVTKSMAGDHNPITISTRVCVHERYGHCLGNQYGFLGPAKLSAAWTTSTSHN